MDETSQPAGELTRGLADGIRDRGIGLAFGEPQTVDGVELIPVAFVSYGFGATESSAHLGTGGGGGGVAIPLGVYSSQGGRVAFRPNSAILLALAVPLVSALAYALPKVISALR